MAGLVRLAGLTLEAAGVITHDLAALGGTARGAGEIQVVARPVDTFAARENRRAAPNELLLQSSNWDELKAELGSLLT